MRILLVCTGNTCRSPMAEAMLREMARRDGRALEVRSAGVAATDGCPISAGAAEALRARQVPLPGPSAALTDQDVAWAELVLTMTTGHKAAIAMRYPEAVGKTYTLKEYAMRGEPAMAEVAEAERLYAEWQVQQALGGSLSDEDRARLIELQRLLPDFDIADPFGGSQEDYERSAREIEEALRAVLDKLNAD